VGGASHFQSCSEVVALQGLGYALFTELGEQQDRVLSRRLPTLAIQAAEDRFDTRFPRPEQVVSEMVQLVQHRNALVDSFKHRTTMVSSAMTGA
jgi:hypothetical protein